MKHVVMFSSGIGSWAAAKRVAAEHGTANLTLLFADTMTEDADNYRFLAEGAANVGGELIQVRDGRDIWGLMRAEHSLANWRFSFCSRVLKQAISRRWVREHCEPDETTLYLGFDWSEYHRVEKTRAAWQPYRTAFPLTEPPYLVKADLLNWARSEGLAPPRLYDLGFKHANCGGGCVRAGAGAFVHLLKVLPERYAEWERNEAAIAGELGKDVAILAEERAGVTRPLTLTALRERYERQPRPCDMFADDWGGCGCFADGDEATAGVGVR